MAKKKDMKEIINEKIIDNIVDTDLTEQEQDFILYYLESNNGTQSYLKAYGGEKKFAAFKACRLLKSQKIKSEIKRIKKIMKIGMDIDPSKYLDTLLKVANADIGDYIKFSEEEIPEYDDEGMPLLNQDTGEPITRKVNRMHLEDSSKVDTTVIQEIKQGKDGISIKLVDKMRAWEKLKEFFEWKKQQEDNSKISNNLIEVLQTKTENVWEDDEEGTEDANKLGD